MIYVLNLSPKEFTTDSLSEKQLVTHLNNQSFSNFSKITNAQFCHTPSLFESKLDFKS